MLTHRNVNIFAIAFAASALAGCAARAAPPPKGPPPVSVTTGNVTRGTISTYATFDGAVTPVYQTTLSTAQAGTVESVNVTEGDFVSKGQVLASLDTSQLAASLKANQATVRQDQAQLEHSQVAAPVASQQYSSAVSTARQNLASAQNGVRTARAALTSNDLTQKADRDLLRQGYVSRQTSEQARAASVSANETLRSSRQAVTAQQSALRTALINTDQRRGDQATIAGNAAGLDGARARIPVAGSFPCSSRRCENDGRSRWDHRRLSCVGRQNPLVTITCGEDSSRDAVAPAALESGYMVIERLFMLSNYRVRHVGAATFRRSV